MKKYLASLMVGMLMAVPVLSHAVENGEQNSEPTAASEQSAAGEQLQSLNQSESNERGEDTPESSVNAEDKQAEAQLQETKSQAENTSTVWEVTGLTYNNGTNYVTAFQSNTVKVNTSSEKKGVKYKLVYSYNNWSDWNVISEMSETSTFTWTPKNIGTYKLYLDIQDETGKITTKTYDVVSKRSWTFSSITADANMSVGESHTIIPVVSGGGDLKYKFVYSYNNWSDWKVIQDFSTKATASFIPEKTGTYEIYVDIADSNGNVETKSIKVNTAYGWNLYDIQFDSIANQNNSVKITAKTSGNTANLKYKFVYSYNNWSDWNVIQAESASSTATFKADKAGDYDIYVDVIDNVGNVVSKSEPLSINGAWSYSSVLLSSNSVILGNSVSIVPEVSGDRSSLKYKFVYSYNNWSDWKVIQDFSTSSTVNFTPDKIGKYDIFVDIMDTKTGKTVTKSAAFNGRLVWSFDSITGGGAIKYGAKTTIVPNVSGDKSGLKYKFVYSYNNWSDWSVIQPESTKATAEFTPSKPGKYDIYVDIIDSRGNIVTKTATLNVAAEWAFTGVSISPESIQPGDIITIDPDVSGNTSGLQYKYVYSYNNWSDWGVIKDFSSDAVMGCQLNQRGNYDIYVDIKDSTGYTVTKSVRVTVGAGMVQVINQDWFTVVRNAISRNTIMTIMDVNTGLRFQAKTLFGTNHLDAEPLTASDTATIKQMYGGSFSWNRRAIIVIDGNTAYAASMNGMPHEDQTIKDNNFNGHFCIHFLNSKTHGSDRVDPNHKNAVMIAAGVGIIYL